MAEIFLVFLRLGLTSFGGPIAHLGYFHDEFVARRKWIDEHAYVDLVALCQFLPGPASSQVGIAIGLSRAGIPGAIAAWLGFTLPSAILLTAFGLGLSFWSNLTGTNWMHGLEIVAVAIVGQAIWIMGTKLCFDRARITIALVSAMIASSFSFAAMQIVIIIGGGMIGWYLLKGSQIFPHQETRYPINRSLGGVMLGVFAILLGTSLLLINLQPDSPLNIFAIFYRTGSLVFGGGHVVLPLLQSDLVPSGLISNTTFMTGYGAAQAIPGPLFTLAAFLGAAMNGPAHGIWGAVLCLFAIFLPSFLLVLGILPFWEKIRRFRNMRNTMDGINAAVVGLLIAAFYYPVWTIGIQTINDFTLCIFAILLLVFWKMPSWAVVGLIVVTTYLTDILHTVL